MEKNFNIKYGIGRAKYVINFHNGISKHKDGSLFYDIEIFKNKIKLEKFKKNLIKEGYKEI